MKSLLVILIILADCGFANEPISKRYLICRNNKLIRSIRVIETQKGCETIYTKFGIDRRIGWGMKTEACLEVLERVEQNLLDSWWDCKDVSKKSINK